MAVDPEWLKSHIRDIPGFPSPGIIFKDITPLLADVEAFRATVDALADEYAGQQVDRVIGIEARGFILGAPVAYRLGAAFIPVRKPGKLPHDVEGLEYELEYGTDSLEVHRDALGAGHKVVIIDDVLATGGTAAAAASLVEKLGGEVVGLGFLMELAFLGGRSRLEGRDLRALLVYD
ncbi:MAG: adenine phosphoribosyltransferase [Acidimicrobiales bacterium]|nr:adenine phosphoribosyltransferase [Acidimicrobiales bacterium]MCB9371286.1 adenine phosphoribosyltransferase [Microthrixaceae bacterium]